MQPETARIYFARWVSILAHPFVTSMVLGTLVGIAASLAIVAF